MNGKTTATVEISEQIDESGIKIYHWHIRREDGSEVCHSAYHTDRAKCEAEGQDRLEYYTEQGWI